MFVMLLVIMIMGIFHVSCVSVVDTILTNAVEVAWIVVLAFALAFALLIVLLSWALLSCS